MTRPTRVKHGWGESWGYAVRAVVAVGVSVGWRWFHSSIRPRWGQGVGAERPGPQSTSRPAGGGQSQRRVRPSSRCFEPADLAVANGRAGSGLVGRRVTPLLPHAIGAARFRDRARGRADPAARRCARACRRSSPRGRAAAVRTTAVGRRSTTGCPPELTKNEIELVRVIRQGSFDSAGSRQSSNRSVIGS
jgi:hypothetical protein